MRKALIIFLSLATLGALASVQPAFADCRSDNIACNANGGGAWCGQKYTTCTKQANLAAARQKTETRSGRPAGMTRQTIQTRSRSIRSFPSMGMAPARPTVA